ncbi:MAG: hypothetical protein KME12_19350 [Trichocoleus desertorum ATA4-8-CV12]|jgi:predicted RNA-binding Zn-ribbon protein involved in translation (DUF1610 family)/predicted  nucleic acid-binding Zn-ribbon protein/cell division protein FtsB|nr:hypothetical protein [Trichocoleus desertorum ATA4-8-CV12]
MERAELLQQLKQPKLIADIAAGAIAVLGLFGCFSESSFTRNLSIAALMAGMGTVGANSAIAQLYAECALNAMDKELSRQDNALELSEAQVSELTHKLEEWKTFWGHQQRHGEALKLQLMQAQTALLELRSENGELNSHIALLESNLEAWQQRIQSLSAQQERDRQQAQASVDALAVGVKTTMTAAVVEYRDRLLGSIEATVGQRSDLVPQLKRLATEVKHVATDHLNHITNLPPSSDLKSFVDEALKLLQQEFEELSALKVKYRNVLNTGDKLHYQSQLAEKSVELDELKQGLERFQRDFIPRSQHEAILSEFQVKKDEVLNSLAQQVEALEVELNGDTDAYMQKLLQQIDWATREIANLQEQVEQLRKPQTFSPATRDDLRMGNQIIEYFWLHGILLDRAGSDYRKHETILYFHSDRNPRLILSGELNEHAEKLPQILRCLNVPKFAYDSESGLMSVKLALSRKPPLGVEDVSRLWRPKSQFEKLAAQWIRVRVTGGSEAGKSPTAENLAVCLLKAHPGQVKLSNPQYHSRKNYWSIPVTWTSHKESVAGMKELADRVERRSTGAEGFEEFVLYMFDEIDSTFVKHKSASQYVLSAVKQASHQNLGMIFIGQNANASEYPGMDRSDFENCVNVHIGSNAKHAIVNSNMSSDLKSELQNQYDKLMEFCEAKNAELSLDKTDPQAYRFALVIEPQKKPYFIELPHFGCYGFDQITSVKLVDEVPASSLHPSASTRIHEPTNPDSVIASEMASASYVGVGCPKCKEGILSRTKKNRGSLLYVCDSCGKSTSEGIIAAQLITQLGS